METPHPTQSGLWIIGQPLLDPRLIPHDKAAATLFWQVPLGYATLFPAREYFCVQAILDGKVAQIENLWIRAENGAVLVSQGNSVLRRYQTEDFSGALFDWVRQRQEP